jgi:hypothetical protein
MSMAFGLLLEKLAYGPDDIRRVLRVTDKITAREGIPTFAAAQHTAKEQTRAARRMVERAAALAPHMVELPPEAVTQATESMVGPIPRKGGRIYRMKAGRGVKFPEARALAGIFSSEPLDQKNLGAVSSVIRGHEMDELGATTRGPSIVTQGTGHGAPSVIFRESNRVATLPEDLRPAGDTMRKMRAGNEAIHLFEPFGLEYGKGRLSRHAIRRLSERLEQKGVRFHGARLGAAENAAATAEQQRQARDQLAMDHDPAAYQAGIKRRDAEHQDRTHRGYAGAREAYDAALAAATNPSEVALASDAYAAAMQSVADNASAFTEKQREQLTRLMKHHNRFREPSPVYPKEYADATIRRLLAAGVDPNDY